MSDMIDMYRDLKAWARDKRQALGVDCPNCRIKQPKRTPTILLPQQRCKVDGYRDPRPESLVAPTILLPQQRCKVDGYRDPRPESLVADWERQHAETAQ